MKNTSNSSSTTKHIRTLSAVGLFCALAYVCCVIFHFKASFLTFDIKDAVMSIGAMIFGPIYGVAMAFIVALIEGITVSSTGIYGFIMNVLSSVTFVGISSFVYNRRRTFTGALIGMISASVMTVLIMMLANLLITPFYMNVSRADVAALIPTLLLPFNTTKVIFNSAVVFLLYKPIITAMRHAGFMSFVHDRTHTRNNSSPRTVLSIVVTAVAALVAVVALIYFFMELGGSINVG